MEFTGERFIPGLPGLENLYFEHISRYMFVREYIRDQAVLDVGSGSGYGAAWLADNGAKRVVGIDISSDAVQYAQEHYSRDNLEFRVMDASSLQFPDQSFDIVVSFEVIAHIAEQERYMAEIKRVLRPAGIFIVSSPDRASSQQMGGEQYNPWYIKEFNQSEFRALLEQTFPHVEMFSQGFQRSISIQRLSGREALGPGRERKYAPIFLPGQPNIAANLARADQYLVGICCKEALRPECRSDDAVFELSRPLPPILRFCHAEKYLVAIVIPVYNKLDYTRRCLETLLANPDVGASSQIIVIDNASSDGTAEYLAGLGEKITVISNSTNLGFVDASNQGVAAASAKYILFLNNDTKPQPNFLYEMVRVIEEDPQVGAVGAKLIYPDGKLQEAGGIIFRDARGWNYGRQDDPNRAEYCYLREVDYCSGACLLVASSVLQALGNGFDRRYAPAYYEDTDLCFGVRQLGRKVMYQPRAEVIHYEGVTAGVDVTQGFKRYQVLNHPKFVEKWNKELQAQQPHHAWNVGLAHHRASKENILFIYPYIPKWDRASGSLAVYNTIKMLCQKGHHVTLLAKTGIDLDFYRKGFQDMGVLVYDTDPEKLRQTGSSVAARPIMLPEILSARPYALVYIYFYNIAQQYLNEIRIFSPQSYIAINSVDIHYKRTERRAEVTNDPQQRELAGRVKQQELDIYRQADCIIAVTDEDKKILRDDIRDVPIKVIPDLHEVKSTTTPFQSRNHLLFVGNFEHFPNIDAMQYFCRHTFPLIEKRLPGVKFFIVGSNPPDEVRKLAGPNILVTGYVPSTDPYVQACRVSLAPLRFGSGMKGKICEAFKNGIAVVASPIAAEGMHLVHEEHLLIAQSDEDFAAEVVRLYHDPVLWQKLVDNGKKQLDHLYGPAVHERLVADLVSTASQNFLQREVTSVIVYIHKNINQTMACVESIIKNTPRPYQLILITDGCREDEIKKYIRWQERVFHINNTQRIGFTPSMAQAMRVATGKYLFLMPNEIEVRPGWLEKMLHLARSRPNLGLIVPYPGNIKNRAAGIFARDEFCLFIRRSLMAHLGALQPGANPLDDYIARTKGANFESVSLDEPLLVSSNRALSKGEGRRDGESGGSVTGETLEMAGLGSPDLALIIPYSGPLSESGRRNIETLLFNTPRDLRKILITDTRDYQTFQTMTKMGIQTILTLRNASLAQVINWARRERNETYLGFISPRVVVSQDWLKPLLDALQKPGKLGLCGPLSNLNAAQLTSPLRLDYQLKDLRKWAKNIQKERRGRQTSVVSLDGHCFFVALKTLQRIGPAELQFATEYAAGELALRLQQVNFQNILAEESFVHVQTDETWNSPESPAGHERKLLALMTAGFTREQQQDWAGAIHCYESARGIRKEYPLAEIALGSCRFQQSASLELLAALEQQLTNFPAGPALYNFLGCAHFLLGQIGPAKEYLNRSIELDRAGLDARKNLGDVFMAEKNFNQAIRVYETIILDYPDELECLNALGSCYFHMKVYSAAQMAFERVLAIDPNNHTARENLAVVQSARPEIRPIQPPSHQSWQHLTIVSFSDKEPDPARKLRWGDHWFKKNLEEALADLGYLPYSKQPRVLLHLFGAPLERLPANTYNICWLHSHPDAATLERLKGYHKVYCLSPLFTAKLCQAGIPAETLIGATNCRPGAADPNLAHDLVFVGNGRGGRGRPVISALTPANLRRCAIWGEGFEGLVPASCLKGHYFPNEKLPSLYASAGIVLNDHHDDMRREGFLNPRLLDVLASGGVVLSDPLAGGTELFGSTVEWWHSPAELNQKIAEILARDAATRAAAVAAGIRLATGYSFQALAAEFIRHIEAQLADKG